MSLYRCTIAYVFLTFLMALPSDADETNFSFDSSPTSYIGQGFTDYFVSPETGWTILARRNFDGGVSLQINRDGGGAPTYSNYYWTLDFAAPFGATLTPGLYLDTARFPFQANDQPGLTLSGNHRGNNRNGGFFEVLEAVYDANGNVLRFSADFVQYGETFEDWWVMGSIRFNASEPVSPISIDVLPYRAVNTVNWKSRGTLPVSIFGSSDFDVNQLDIESLRLSGAAPWRYRSGRLAYYKIKDTNRDGYEDLLIRFPIREIRLAESETEIQLSGCLFDGSKVLGSDYVNPQPIIRLLDILPNNEANLVNRNSRGTVPVAINGSENLDVTQLDIDSLRLGNAAPRRYRNGRLGYIRVSDMNRDGFVDLLVRFPIQDIGLRRGTQEVNLTGFLTDGGFIFASDIATSRR